MNTIITDSYNLLPVIFGWLGLRSLWHSYAEWQQGAPYIALLDACIGVFFVATAIHRVLKRRLARREEAIPAIARAPERAP
ncbi:hypothetical protein AQZ52_10145 [Novosphingobium fuchskuhlense]|uniref:Uncharacterized protein n=1 Tax=Novosphingobium fuchskuhlense TaxID=1117702 RepID=A0A117UUE7_9SPHN|nr:hypothetical protein [Novosphingobium fuchskuhlense]KUR71046.1 hypothetical protein AQZ52_10145 [Novosphingobium fuchskuhlense]